MKAQCTIIATCFVLIGWCNAAFKKWVPNTNFDNAANWKNGHLPCANDRIVFPERLSAPIFMQANISTTELVLPINGELVLGDYASITFPSENTNLENCPGQDVQFTRTSAESWMDPSNWCEAASRGGDCLVHQPARLDTQKVPCQFDDVIFPKDSSFLVDLSEGVDIFVGSLTIGGKPYTTDSFSSYLASNAGQNQFIRQSSTVNVKQEQCEDAQSCVCGNHRLQEKICEQQKKHCSEPLCSNPLDVDGHCCILCGAKIEMEYGPAFRYDTLYNVFSAQLRKNRANDVEFIMTRTSLDKIMVVVKDEHDGHRAAEIGLKMAQLITKDIEGLKKYGILQVLFYTSNSNQPSTGALTGRTSLSSSSIIGIVLSMVIFTIIVVVCIICFVDKGRCIKQRLPSISLRFHNKPDEEQLQHAMELGPSADFKDVSFASATDPSGFDNPMYASGNIVEAKHGLDDNANSNASPINLSDVTFVRADNISFDNPMYDTIKPEETTEEKGDVKDNPEEGFSNPMFNQNGKLELLFDDPSIKLNPIYGDDCLEEDSTI